MNKSGKWALLLLWTGIAWAEPAPQAGKTSLPSPQVTAVSSSAPSPLNAAPVGQLPGYRVGGGDHLRVTVFGEVDLTGDYTVSANGQMAFPLVGDVEVAGKRTDEIADALTAALKQGYLLSPRVSVAVTKYRPFYILGEVATPGTYPFAPDLTVMGAVATAGGFTYRANRRQVYIKNMGGDEHRMKLDGNAKVEPGDTIRIGERLF